MKGNKTERLHLRITPEIKRMVVQLANRQHRDMSNLIEVLILQEARKQGLERDVAVEAA